MPSRASSSAWLAATAMHLLRSEQPTAHQQRHPDLLFVGQGRGLIATLFSDRSQFFVRSFFLSKRL